MSRLFKTLTIFLTALSKERRGEVKKARQLKSENKRTIVFGYGVRMIMPIEESECVHSFSVTPKRNQMKTIFDSTKTA